MSSAPLVLVVGRAGAQRAAVSQALVDRGHAVVVCGGPVGRPAGCALVRQERCSLVDNADAVVILPPARSGAGPLLALCARRARSSILVGRSTGRAAPDVIVVPARPITELVAAVDSALGGHTQRPRAAANGTPTKK